MSVPKAKALLTVCAALLLCGCGQALSEREEALYRQRHARAGRDVEM